MRTEFSLLPPDVQREIVILTIALTKATIDLGAATAHPAEFWIEHLVGDAFQSVQRMNAVELDRAIAQIESLRRS